MRKRKSKSPRKSDASLSPKRRSRSKRFNLKKSIKTDNSAPEDAVLE